MFKTEYEMVVALISILKSKSLSINQARDFIIMQEVEGLVGRPDILLKSKKNKKVITIELKLKNWKRALAQAYKYKSFSDISYVCMDESNIDSVLKHLDMFKKYNIGLITISKNKKVNIIYKPIATEPYVKDLYAKASSKLDNFESNNLVLEHN